MNHSKSSKSIQLGIYTLGLIMMGVIGINSSLSAISAAFPDLSQTMIQNLISIPCIVIIPVTLIAGKLRQIIGSRILAIIGALCFIIGGVFPLFLKSFTVILFMRAILGIGVGISQVIASALSVEHFEGAQSQRIQGNLQTAQMIGVIVMAALCGRLADISWNYAFLVHLVGILSLIGAVCFVPGKTKLQGDSKSTSAKSSKIHLTAKSWLWALAMCTVFITIQVYQVTFSYLITEKNLGDASASGLAVSLFAVGGAVMGLIYGKLSDFFKQYTIALGCLCFACSYILLVFAGSLGVCYVGCVIFGFAIVITLPRIFIEAGLSTDAASSGFAVSLVTCAQNLGQFLCPYIINPISNIFLPSKGSAVTCFILGIIFALVLMIVFAIWGHRSASGS